MAKKKLESSVLKNFAEDSYRKISNEKLKISFKFVDWESQEFFLHGLSQKYIDWQKLKNLGCDRNVKASKL